ncbi:hypothetical protein GOBAR_DD29820 [Gossypium barbadense]|nr:hypothetical protein GOBAR_DD29820 [Gossypium barbadense]
MEIEMSLEEKFKIIRSVGEECIQEDELLNLLNLKPEPICYDGFEPSGRMHIAQGIRVLATCDRYSSQKQAAQDNEADIFQLGMDQRKICFLVSSKDRRKCPKVIHHHQSLWKMRRFKSLTKTNYFEILEELDISDNQIRVLPESFRLLSKLRVFRADKTPLEVPPREVVVEFMADLIAKRDTKAAPPKKEKGSNFPPILTMPKEKTSIDYVLEKASRPHFSGLRSPTATATSTALSDANGPRQPFVMGVSGGTASGKTTVCDMIIQQLHDHRVVLANQDSFYRGLTTEELKRVHEYNFDNPDAFDTEQLLGCIEKLKDGQSVQVNASDDIILEGILVFHDQCVRNLMNMKIFVDTDADVRLARRIRRDMVERGRDVSSVLEQYAKFVKPAFDGFVLPSKKYANVIIPRGGENHVAIDLIVQHLRTKLGYLIRGMHTLIRDREISKHDFVFYSDRLIRLVVEHGLGHFPFTEKQVITPTASVYTGVDFAKSCVVFPLFEGFLLFIYYSGESMENALRACCKGIKIGKILIHRDGDNGKHVSNIFGIFMLSAYIEKLPKDISERHVLLLDLVLATGNSANHAIELLVQKGVPESHIIFLNLVSAPEGIHCVCKRFPSLKVVTSEIDVALNGESVSYQLESCNYNQYQMDQLLDTVIS